MENHQHSCFFLQVSNWWLNRQKLNAIKAKWKNRRSYSSLVVILSRIYKLHLPKLFPCNHSVTLNIGQRNSFDGKTNLSTFHDDFCTNSSRENILREMLQCTLFAVSVQCCQFMKWINRFWVSWWSAIRYNSNFCCSWVGSINRWEIEPVVNSKGALSWIWMSWRVFNIN